MAFPAFWQDYLAKCYSSNLCFLYNILWFFKDLCFWMFFIVIGDNFLGLFCSMSELISMPRKHLYSESNMDIQGPLAGIP